VAASLAWLGQAGLSGCRAMGIFGRASQMGFYQGSEGNRLWREGAQKYPESQRSSITMVEEQTPRAQLSLEVCGSLVTPPTSNDSTNPINASRFRPSKGSGDTGSGINFNQFRGCGVENSMGQCATFVLVARMGPRVKKAV